jgi:hypothetical protein
MRVRVRPSGLTAVHRSLAAWLCERPWRAAWLAALLGVLSLQGVILMVPVASAIPVLLWLHRGPKFGMNVGLVGSVAVVAVLMYFKQSVLVSVACALILFGLPMLWAALLARFGSLNLVFQLTLLAALMFLAGVFVLLPEPIAIWQQAMEQVFNSLQASGVQMDAQFIPQLARTMWGAMVAVLVTTTLGSVFLGRWWQMLQVAPGAFGREFRQLSSGNVLGTVLAMIAAASLVSDFAWLNSMSWVAMLGLALQGLAAAHRRKAEGHLKHGWLVAIYVLLIVPLFSFVTVALLAGLGLADFWKRAAARS